MHKAFLAVAALAGLGCAGSGVQQSALGTDAGFANLNGIYEVHVRWRDLPAVSGVLELVESHALQ